MALVSCILWVVVGVFYVIYKLGEDASGSRAGGIGCAILVALGLYVFYLIANFSMDLVIGLVLAGIIVGFAYLVIRGIKDSVKENRSSLAYQERNEIVLIRNELPRPTWIQMAQFYDDLRNEEEPSRLQIKYLRQLQNSQLSEKHFLDMQAAWVYYSQYDTWSRERQRIFGQQDLASKAYFRPTYDKEANNDHK